MMDNFIPEQGEEQDVPYFDDVSAEEGWQGQATGKSMQDLKLEISQAMGRLGGVITSIQQGSFGDRDGFRIHFAMGGERGQSHPGKIDIAALPVKKGTVPSKQGYEKRKKSSLLMALFMARNALDGAWFLRQLSPGANPLMPWMLVPGSEHTFSQAFKMVLDGVPMPALPEPDPETVEGEFEVSE